ncbi:MAG: D-glycerate dehydrogenase, partial [Chloroflexi bacterium]|nr:D-glycerate dehydrogenase [Chloroflexota bacterium]
MSKLKLFIAREFFRDIIEKLYDYYDVEIWEGYEEIPYEVLLSRVKDVDALVSFLSNRIDCQLLSEAK